MTWRSSKKQENLCVAGEASGKRSVRLDQHQQDGLDARSCGIVLLQLCYVSACLLSHSIHLKNVVKLHSYFLFFFQILREIVRKKERWRTSLILPEVLCSFSSEVSASCSYLFDGLQQKKHNATWIFQPSNGALVSLSELGSNFYTSAASPFSFSFFFLYPSLTSLLSLFPSLFCYITHCYSLLSPFHNLDLCHVAAVLIFSLFALSLLSFLLPSSSLLLQQPLTLTLSFTDDLPK